MVFETVTGSKTTQVLRCREPLFSDKNQQFPTLLISANKITYFVFKK